MSRHSMGATTDSFSHLDQVPIEQAMDVARVLREDAKRVDEEGMFPVRGIQALKQAGLMSLLVPKQDGGMGGSYTTLCEVSQVLSAECLSTALVWAMHCQQVAVLMAHAPEPLRTTVLRRVAKSGSMIASITSEPGKGGHLLTALAPLVVADGDILLTRHAPTATGGLHADAYLVTMRASESSPPSHVVLVYAERNSLEVDSMQDWKALGMRGTQSVGLALRGRLSENQIVNHPRDFKQIAVTTMIPVGHLAWAACWLGAARRLFDRAVTALRDPSARGMLDLKSDLFAERLARVRLNLDTVDCYLARTVQNYEELMEDPEASYAALSSPSFQLRINGLKILASELSFRVTDELMELMGMRMGYLTNDDVPIERVFRDLRSASLMFSNYRLLIANGKLAMLDAFKESS